MTMEQLNKAVTDAQRAVAVVTCKRTENESKRSDIRAKIDDLHEESSGLMREYFEMSNEVLAARSSLRKAECALNTAVNNAIIAEHHRPMTERAFLESLREVLRSKKPIAECLVERLERNVAGTGAAMERLSYWAEDGRVRDLSGPQVRRVESLLNTVCPKTAAGNYLPPYEVQYPR